MTRQSDPGTTGKIGGQTLTSSLPIMIAAASPTGTAAVEGATTGTSPGLPGVEVDDGPDLIAGGRFSREDREACADVGIGGCFQALNAAAQAKQTAAVYFPEAYHPVTRSDDGTKRNAMDHAFWNAQMVRMVGRDAAKRFADAHEGNCAQSNTCNSANEMDLWNNTVGRDMGEAMPRASDTEVADAVYAAILAGRMRILNGDDPPQLIPSNSPDGF